MVNGFVYVNDENPGPMVGATPGKRVTKTSLEPPWIVVDHSLDRVLVVTWPGRLFRVASVPPSTGEEQDALRRAAENLRPDAGYTRVLAVDVLEELAPSVLFGPHGDAVIGVLNVGRYLTEHRAGQLAAARHPQADEAYGRAWARWLSEQPNGSPYLLGDNSRTLAVPGAGRSRSPIGHGFTTLSAAVHASARQRGAADAIVVDEDGDEVLAEPWATARRALLHAAMAFGAPELICAADRSILIGGWTSVLGPDQPSTAR